MLVETVLSMLTTVFHSKKVGHRVWAYFRARVAWTMAREMMSGEYRDYVDALMREVVPRAPTDTLKTWQSLMSRELGVAA